MKVLPKLGKRRQQLRRKKAQVRRKKVDDASFKMIDFSKYIVFPDVR